MNFVVIDIGLESFPPLLFAALRFGLIAFPAIFFVPQPDVRWTVVIAVGLFIGVGQFGLLFVAMSIGLPAGLASVIAPLQPLFTIPFAVVWRWASVRVCARSPEFAVALAGLGVIAAGRFTASPSRRSLLVSSRRRRGAPGTSSRDRRARSGLSLCWSGRVWLRPCRCSDCRCSSRGSGVGERAASSVDASGVMALAYFVIVSTFFGYGVGVLADVAVFGFDGRALHATCTGDWDHHRLAGTQWAPDLGRAGRPVRRAGRPRSCPRGRRCVGECWKSPRRRSPAQQS